MPDDKFKLGILTISDTGSKGQRQDTSGDAISDIMAHEGFVEVVRDIVPDERDIISAKLIEWCDGGTMDLILTTGGTGLGPRAITPEATRDVLDIEVPGLAEAMRVQTLKHTPLAMLSRSMAGLRSGCMIVNLPGSEKAVRETLAVAVEAIPHGLQMVKGWRMH